MTNQADKPSVEGLNAEEREHIHQAIDMLGDYEATQREQGNDSTAEGAGATRYVLEKLFRFLPARLASPPSDKAEAQPVAHKATDEQVTAWAARYDLRGNLSEWRAMFEDAQTLVPALPLSAQPLESRTPQDYAIEHAEYMAKDGDRLIDALHALSEAEVKREEADDDTPELEGAVHDARDTVWEYVRGLRSGIYEFRKRRDRAAPLESQAVEVLTAAARDVLAERERQKTGEGWTPDHDDQHEDGSLSAAAACYATALPIKNKYEDFDVSMGRGDTPLWRSRRFRVPTLWPDSWHAGWWKPKTPREDLIRAGALILAEIERLDRARSLVEKEGGK